MITKYKRKPAAILLLILAGAVLLRLISAFILGNTVQILPGVYDQISYHNLAYRFLNGYGFTFNTTWWPLTPAGQPTAHWSYLYTLYLTALYAIFGPSPLAARLTQAVLAGILLPWLTYRVGLQVFTAQSESVSSDHSNSLADVIALIAAAWTAIYGYFIYYSAALMTEAFYILGILWILDSSLRLMKSDSKRQAFHWLELGLAICISAYFRQLILLFLPFLFLWFAWVFINREKQQKSTSNPIRAGLTRTLIGGLWVSILLAVLILPTTYFNYRQFGKLVLLNTNAGFALFWANHPIYGDRFQPILSPELSSYQELIPENIRHFNEAALDQALLRRGMEFIFKEPGRFIRLSISRIPEYFKFWYSPGSSVTSNLARILSFGIALPFMILGIVRWRQLVKHGVISAPPGALLLLFSSMYALIHILSWALIRYRLPVDAVLMPFAACGLYWVVAKIKLENHTAASVK